MASGGDGRIFSNVSTTQGPFKLNGGTYGLSVVATWNSGSVTLEMLAADGSTYIPALAAFSANGYGAVALPPGQYKLVVASATGVYMAIARIN